MPEETRRRVLIAQDNANDREFAARFLETLGGYETFQVGDGMGLIKALKSRPDLILMDTARKGKFLQALEIIRRTEAFSETPIVMYSTDQQALSAVANKRGDALTPEISEESFKELGISSDQLTEWEPQIQVSHESYLTLQADSF